MPIRGYREYRQILLNLHITDADIRNYTKKEVSRCVSLEVYLEGVSNGNCDPENSSQWLYAPPKEMIAFRLRDANIVDDPRKITEVIDDVNSLCQELGKFPSIKDEALRRQELRSTVNKTVKIS